MSSLVVGFFVGCGGPSPGTDSGPTPDAGPGGPTCSDGLRNQDESDVDCGGACGATCEAGEGCVNNSDCVTTACADGTCAVVATCADGELNGMETDVDCGGTMCMGCATGGDCLRPEDCESIVCLGDSTCAAPVCGDGVTNGVEACDDGADGTPAESASCNIDCTSAVCGDGWVNASASEICDGDGAGAGGETATCDTDCTVPECGDGIRNAAVGEECDGDGAGVGGESATCNANCTTPVCGDGIHNSAAGEECDDGNSDDGDRCTSACARVLTSTTFSTSGTFDTGAGTFNGTPVVGWDAVSETLHTGEFAVATGATVTVVGTAPLRVLAAGNISVLGRISAPGGNGGRSACNTVSGTGGAGGAGGSGGSAGGAGGNNTVRTGSDGLGSGVGGGATSPARGGGGAGHETMGAAGQTLGTGGGLPGPAYDSILTLEGGSGGGGGGWQTFTTGGWIGTTNYDGGGGGGGGGGAVLLDTYGDITVVGVIDVGGGNGGSSACGRAGSGGGGSGGTLILWADGVIDTATATLDIAGGVGATAGADGGRGADGQVILGARPTCWDGIVNQDETDIDCGGTLCGPCSYRAACLADTDCTAGSCLRDLCQDATCVDGSVNGTETDLDCGGAACRVCVATQGCLADDDCRGGICTAGVCEGALRTCADHLRVDPSAADGAYAIDPDATGTPDMVYCDMTVDGGGWTLVSSNLNSTTDDAAAAGYFADLARRYPITTNAGIWAGLRGALGDVSDIRFTCRNTPGMAPMAVDLSFYDVPWYAEITTGTDVDSCFNENNGAGHDGPVARRDNISSMTLAYGDRWDRFGFLEGEDSCGDTGDFTVDFDDVGVGGAMDGTDWGEWSGVARCGTSTSGTGEWHIWVRER